MKATRKVLVPFGRMSIGSDVSMGMREVSNKLKTQFSVCLGDFILVKNCIFPFEVFWI